MMTGPGGAAHEANDDPIVPPTRPAEPQPGKDPRESDDDENDTLPGEDLPDIHVRKVIESPDGEEENDDAEGDAAATDGPPQFVTTLAPIEHQVGMHVIEALRREDVTGVVTTVVEGPDGLQRIVSVGLDADQLSEVERIVTEGVKRKRARRVPCIGFHCRVREDQAEE